MPQGKMITFERDDLEELYWTHGLSTMDIADIFGCGWSSVCRAMHRFRIPLRDRHMRNGYSRNPAWRGGRVKGSQGYIFLKLLPDDPYISMAGLHNYCLEHRYVMAQHLGRILPRSEQVHHKNGRKDDNRLENLELVSTSNHHLYTALCQDCQLRKDIKLLQWMVKELQTQLISKGGG